jgi:hypothetical protein
MSKQAFHHYDMVLQNGDVIHFQFLSAFTASQSNEPLQKTEAQGFSIDWQQKVIDAFIDYVDSGKPSSTIKSYWYAFKRYADYCVRNEVHPFQESGFFSFFGSNGELWRKVKEGRETNKFLFLYKDGEELGLKESTAVSQSIMIKGVLNRVGIDTEYWSQQVPKFKKSIEPVPPYTSKEFDLIIGRLLHFFYSLSEQLIEGKTNQIDFKLTNINSASIGSVDNKKQVIQFDSNPINQCMTAAYCLFAFYTSFNAGPISDLSHPIQVQTKSKQNRTSRYAVVSGRKGRGNKIVTAILSDEIENRDKHHNDQVTFKIEKKTGVRFLEQLIRFSQLFSPPSNNNLFYWFNTENSQLRFSCPKEQRHILAGNLNLLSESRTLLCDYFLSQFELALQGKRQKVGIKIDGERNSKVRFSVHDDQYHFSNMVRLGYLIVSCFTDYDLKGALRPVEYIGVFEGILTIKISFIDRESITLSLPEKFRKVIEILELTSNFYIPNNAKRTPHLFAVRNPETTEQWSKGSKVGYQYLLNMGVANGDYFVRLTPQNIRATILDMVFKAEDKGLTARIIGQNSKDVQMQHYANGHPKTNQLIMSQGIECIQRISSKNVMNLDDAIESVKKERGVTLLSIEEYKAKKLVSNENGLVCDGSPSGDALLKHRAAQRHAQGLDEYLENMDCFQYDKCYQCKSAKVVNDEKSVYKLLSFIDYYESQLDLYPQNTEITSIIAEYQDIVTQNISRDILTEAERLFYRNGPFKWHG